MKTVFLASVLILTSCASQGDKARQQSAINKLNVDKALAKGTPQDKVLEVFGSPNTVTSNGDGFEVWSYLRSATNSNSNSVGATIWNSSLNYVSWGYLSGNTSNSTSTTNDSSLIVYFDKTKRVTNHSFRTETY